VSGRRTGREAASRPFSRWRAKSSGHPFALTIATARRCYAARPVSVEDVAAAFDPAVDAMAAAGLSGGLVAAGRHATLQRARFVFVLDGVSRLAIWSFLHAPPASQTRLPTSLTQSSSTWTCCTGQAVPLRRGARAPADSAGRHGLAMR
jgi:hypothetical protein